MSEVVAIRDPLRARNAVLGFVALALLVGSIGYTWKFLRGDLRGGVPVSAVFSERGAGQQLPVGGDVKVRGVLVGHIDEIRLDTDGMAVVELRLEDDVELPSDTAAEIRSKTVFGQKWVELIPPDSGSGVLEAGSVIPDERTAEPLELERELQLGHELLARLPLRDLSRALEALADGFSGQEEDARKAIDKGLIALRAVNSRSGDLDEALGQLNEFATWLDANDTELVAFMDSLDSANRALVGAAPEFKSSLDSVPVFLNDLAAFQESIEPDLGRLVNDGATVLELLAARRADLVDLVVQLEPFTTVWNSGLSQPCAGPYESDLTCWQVFQMPGQESRGLYGRRAPSPLADEPGDPLRSMLVPHSWAGR